MEYFAALPAEQLAAELKGRVDAYYNWILSTGRLARWRIAYDTYYGQRGSHNSSYVSPAGEKGELSFLMSNEYRNLIQHLLVLAFQSRPSLEVVATNTDSKSKAQAYVARGLVEYYRRDGRIDDNTRDATEIALIMDTGWTFNEWDVLLGQEVAKDPDTGEIKRQGDIKSRARTPLDVVIDFTKPQGHQRDWILVRDPVNKFDLAAQYPEMAEDITNLQRDYTRDALFRFGELFQHESGFTSPDIDVWTFYHRRSPSMPNGRMFQFTTEKLTFFDDPIPYRKLPGNRICPTEQILSALGYSNGNDLLGLQDVIDAMISSAATNMTATAGNTIWTKEVANFDYQQLADGMSLIQSEDEPKVLMFNRVSPEWLPVMNFFIQRQQTISGINSVARGDVMDKEFSGAAMALLQSMAIQFNNGLVRAVNRLVEDNGNDVIMLTQDFASSPRLGMIIGQNNKYMIREYAGKDIAQIQRTYCRQSNPIKDTTSGKMTLLDKYMAVPGLVKTADQINEVVETGSLDSLTEPGRNRLLSIDQENEALINGEVPPVWFGDNPMEHLQGHARIFASPDDRRDPALLARVKAHYDAHMQAWRETDPAILAALNIPPFPVIPPPMMPPPPGDGSGQPPPIGAPPGSPGMLSPPADAPAGVPGPNLPTNPLSGAQWDPATGGIPG